MIYPSVQALDHATHKRTYGTQPACPWQKILFRYSLRLSLAERFLSGTIRLQPDALPVTFLTCCIPGQNVQ